MNAMGGVRAATSGASGTTSGEEKRRAELEARGRAEVADLYERAVITTRIDPMLWKPEQAAYSQPTFRNLLWENKIRKRTRRPIERRNIIC